MEKSSPFSVEHASLLWNLPILQVETTLLYCVFWNFIK